jgi:hypothetical protein
LRIAVDVVEEFRVRKVQLRRVDANDVTVPFVELLNLEYILPSLDTVKVEFIPSESVELQNLERRSHQKVTAASFGPGNFRRGCR